MVRQTETEDLESAWRALAGESAGEGWRTIAVSDKIRCRILAGRHFPGNEEAVLVGFPSVSIPSKISFPAGHGFAVRAVDLGNASEGCTWFGLMRQSAGRLEFFATMANDVVSALTKSDAAEDEKLLALFLGRVRAWQIFMEREREGVLGTEAELGLHGELLVLLSLLESGVNPSIAVHGWCGPLDGIHDFQFPGGAIEVKTTANAGTFPATVSSLEQLDDSLVSRLFLTGVRFRLDPEGENLPERVERIRRLLQKDVSTLAAFETRMLHAGFFPAFSDSYSRAFTHEMTRIFRVGEGFPRITHGSIHKAIRRARYEIDLDLVDCPDIPLLSVLSSIGAL